MRIKPFVLLAALCGFSGSLNTAEAADAPAPSAIAFSRTMVPGWNLGNSLEAVSPGAKPSRKSLETAWGNPGVTPELLAGVKAAGFNSVRIPVAWDQYSGMDGDIFKSWLDRVGTVVDDARAAGLTVIINVHWDGGWQQPTYAAQAAANAKLAKFWTQIATYFGKYDEHLLFAGTNEVMVKDNYNPPTAENCAVQNGFNQVFVDTVRATGGANATRYLVVQSYNTNIDYAVSCNATLPKDTVAGKLMMEVHYYDPYSFTLDGNSSKWQWGHIATDPSATDNWGGEDHADAQFEKMKKTFVDKGIPVIVGEYCASARFEYDSPGKYRTYWDAYITRSAVQHGLVPMYWDAGATGNHGSGLFNRFSGHAAYPQVIKAIIDAAK